MGVKVVESSLLRETGFVHAFTTRAGGVSRGAYKSLNLGFGVGDDDACVEENQARLCRALGIAEFWRVQQVHGRDVLSPAPGDDIDASASIEADALVAKNGQAVAVRAADCLPLLLADRETGVVAAVHCGWRSVVAGIVELVSSQLGGYPRNWVGAIGPHIRPDNFEIGEEVARQLVHSSASSAASRREGKYFGHLSVAVRMQLRVVGMADDQLEDVGCDSYETRFFSYRRDGGATGRQVGIIVGQERR